MATPRRTMEEEEAAVRVEETMLIATISKVVATKEEVAVAVEGTEEVEEAEEAEATIITITNSPT